MYLYIHDGALRVCDCICVFVTHLVLNTSTATSLVQSTITLA